LSFVKKRVIISACILGEYCRYDGKTKKVEKVLEAYKEYEIIPFCPEAPLFGTPRERINVVEMDGQTKILKDSSGEDVTELLENEIENFIKKYPYTDAIVLKSKSPSCGNSTTPILNKYKEIISYGDGIATTIFRKNYQDIPIKDENT